jgi:hypothetical protein
MWTLPGKPKIQDYKITLQSADDVRFTRKSVCVVDHLRKKMFPRRFGRSLQTDYKLAMNINYFARNARHHSRRFRPTSACA